MMNENGQKPIPVRPYPLSVFDPSSVGLVSDFQAVNWFVLVCKMCSSKRLPTFDSQNLQISKGEDVKCHRPF